MMKAGTILIDTQALRPQCFHVEDDWCPNGWVPVTHSQEDGVRLQSRQNDRWGAEARYRERETGKDQQLTAGGRSNRKCAQGEELW